MAEPVCKSRFLYYNNLQRDERKINTDGEGAGMTDEQLIQTALDCGATHAEIIGQESIVLNAEFRAMCEANRCGAYGKCYMCPPDVGPVDELMRKIRGYEKGLFYQVIAPLEDSFDIEGMAEAKKLLVQLSQRLLDALRPVFGDGALHLSGGGCGLCPTCAKATEEPCRHPDRAMASLESCGMDVYNTTKHTSMKYVNGANTVTYFGMVLYTEREHG